MKNFIEKVKANKLRSALIGLSVFLFGFIAVNVFNNIGDTYAVNSDPICPVGWYFDDEGFTVGDGACCPANPKYEYDGEYLQTCSLAGAIGDDYETCPYGTRGDYGTCWIKGVQPQPPACYACGGSSQGGATYKWGNYSLSSYCNKISQYSTQSSCEAQNNSSQCYYCGSSNTYKWSAGTPTSSCPGGINWTLKSGVSQTNCERGNACYACGGSQGVKYVWGLYGDSGSCAYQNDITSYSACTAKNVRTISATFNVTDGGSLSGSTTAQCTTTQSSPNSCKVTAPNATRSGYYLQGWSTSQSCSSYIGVDDDPDTIDIIYLNNYYQGNLYTCWGTEPPNDGNYNPTIDEDATVAYTRPIYTVTYDLDGGKFIDGTTSRTSYIPADKAIGDPKTNPIKDGMKFKEWQLDGTKFDFSQKPTKNITLKAVYEELTDEDKLYYCENDSDVLEVSTKTCYNVMKLDESKKLYNYTLYSYTAGGTFCYAYNATNNTPGGVYFRTDVSGYEKVTGKQGTDYSVYGYPGKEAWVSKDTCLIATECTEAASVNRPACETRWDAIIYSTKSALLKEEKIEEDGIDVPIDDEPINPDTPSDDEKDNTDKDNNDKDVSESPKTGDVLILIAWAVGIGALCYTVYYFRKKKEN